MSVIRAIFMGTPDLAAYCLERVAGDEHFKIVGVVTQPDRPAGRKLALTPSPVRLRAEALGLPVFTPGSVNTPDFIQVLSGLQAEAVIVVAFGQILKEEFLTLFPGRIVNVHASLLPRWRGAAPIQRAIMALDKETGVSLQVMVRELDAGDIIGERRLELERHMTAAEVLERMKPLAADLLRMDLMDYLRGHLTPVRQDPSRVTFAPKIKKEEAALDFSQPAEILAAHVRGMTMGPGSFLRIHGKTVKIHRAEAVAGSARLGEIATIHRDSFDVGTARGLLRVFELQPESKGKMSVLDFLRGHALVAGENVSPL